MAVTDRRSGHERRSNERRNVSIDAEWEDDRGRHAGTVSDLSETGCFVLCSGDLEPGEKVTLLLPLGDGIKVEVGGEVRNQVLQIGFAMRFIEPTEAQLNVIKGLMTKYGEYL